MTSPFAGQVTRALRRVRGTVLQVPMLGGGLPLDPIQEVLGAEIIVVPIVNHDNNQHSHNENVRLQNLWDGIESLAALMTMN